MSETIGQQLKHARTTRNLSLAKVTKVTHIQARLLEAMEADDFEALPSPMQARAFLRIYAEYLELSLDDLIARQRLDPGDLSSIPLQPSPIIEPSAGNFPEEAQAAASEGEPPAKKNNLFLEKINAGFLRFRQLISRSKPPLEPHVPIEPAPSSGTLDLETVDLLHDQPDQSGEEIPVSDLTPGFTPPAEIGPSQTIFSSIGAALRQRREALSLTLDEIERHTHIRKHYLQALEDGDFDHLPSSVQTRGMLNNFARFLDLNVDAILLQFAEGLQAQRLERQPASVGNTSSPNPKPYPRSVKSPGLRRYLSMDILVGAGLILVLLVFAIWGTSRIIGLRSGTTPQPTALSISDILATMPVVFTATPTSTSGTGTPTGFFSEGATLAVTIPAAGSGPVQVVLVALEQAFVRVTVDGKVLFNGRVTLGNAYPFSGNNQIEVLTGSGSAISILFNQSNLGPMGSYGQVVDRIYTAKAILNPTATFTPSPTITPSPTFTPRPGQPPLPTATPNPPTRPTATRGGD